MPRYYICGQVGSGTEDDPYRPEIADDLATMVREYVTVEGPDGPVIVPVTPGWAANQKVEAGSPPTPLPRFLVHAVLTEAEHAEVAYDKKTNPNGYDWLEVAEDGTVTLHAA